ncbi:MAG TPA: peptide ABC transporter substrate-binding protein [Anaerolineae bacterium]|nr:peptide ABC transporter substrate-binding protein [Anaerolineae bacterium]HQI85161.1 peptide ABC transporter substrate-binding protein [Anaerolineae bacterium]
MKRSIACTILACLLLVACTATPTATPSPTIAPATATPEPTATPVPSPTPTPKPRTLTICLGSEPASLYLYEDDMYVARVIRQAIYDGPIDTVGYSYQPVILQKLPSLVDGDAVITAVSVEADAPIVDANGDVVKLTSGTRVRPSGCRADDCAVTFDGRPVTMDAMRVTFSLKPEVRWSDGAPLTAQDSVYSFNLARSPDTPNWKWLESRTSSYTATDDYTAVWIGLPGFLDPAYATAFWTPLPEHVWRAYTPATLLEQDAVMRTPLGYGPYVIDKWEPGQYIRLSPNPYYFRAEEGLPYFETLTFRFISNQDVKTGLDALAKGQCDVLSLDLYLERDLPRLQEMEAAGQAAMYPVAAPVWEHLTFNADPPPDYTQPAFFQDVRTRRAVAYCINRQAIIDTVGKGLSTIPDSFLPPEHPLYASNVIRYPYDPAQGQALLEEIGWRDVDGDGIREAHGIPGLFDGTPFHIRYSTTTAETRTQTSALIVADLAACGIQADVEQLDAATFFKDGAGTPLYGRQFDLAEFSWMVDVTPPCDLYLSTQISSANNQWNGQNFGGYHNPVYDAVCQQALAALPGEPEYLTAYSEAQHLFSADLPALPLFFRPRIYAARADLRGFIPDAIAVETWNIEAFALGEE